MPLHFRCPCGEVVYAPNASVDKKGECPSCGKILLVPAGAVATGASIPGKRAPAPSFDEEPIGLKALPAIEIEELPVEAPPAIEIEEISAIIEEVPMLGLQEPAAPVEELPPIIKIEEAPPLVEAGGPSEAPVLDELESVAAEVEDMSPFEGVPDLVRVEAGAPTEEVAAPPPPPPPLRRPPARRQSKTRASARGESKRTKKGPAVARKSAARERGGKRSRTERSARAARTERVSKRSPRTTGAAVCRDCGSQLIPGVSICPECGARIGFSATPVVVLILLIVIILGAIAAVVYGTPEYVPEGIREPVFRVFDKVGIPTPEMEPSGETGTTEGR